MKHTIKAMKKCYLDANLLLYFHNFDSPFHSQADLVLSKLVNSAWQLFLSSLTLDEYFHNALRFTRLPKIEALKILNKSFTKIIKLPNIQLINPSQDINMHKRVLNFMVRYQLRSRDAYHLFIMKENKIEYIATFDHDFDKVFEEGRIEKFEL